MKYTKLDYEITNIKKRTEETEKELQEIKLKIKNVELQIPEQNQKNVKYLNDLLVSQTDYLKTKIRLCQIYQSLGVNDLDSIISNFKGQFIKYEGSSSIVRSYTFNYSFITR